MSRMMLTFLCLTCLWSNVKSQIINTEEDSLKYFYNVKNKITQDGMYVLGAWGAGNLVSGIVASVNLEGTQQYFFQMNAFWGGVNMLISYTSLRALQKTANEPTFIGYAEMDQRKTERIFLINAGLDVFYIGAGLAMINGSESGDFDPQRVEGYGQSFVFQGAFLLGFDLVMYYIHHRNKKKRLKPLLNGLELNGMGITYRFN